MNGAGKKVLGWYKAGNYWVPLQVDVDGKVVVDMSGISLDDIGDIDLTGIADGDILYWDDASSTWKVKAESVFTCADLAACVLNDLGDTYLPGPGDQYFLYWDATSEKWTCRILVDADIPGGIARDAEVATAVSDHAALTTGIHGVGSDYVCKADSDGIPKQIPYLITTAKARAHLSADQSIPNLTWTILTLDTVTLPSYDPGSNFNTATHRFTAPISGYYLNIGVAGFSAPVADTIFHLCIWKNGAFISDSIWQVAVAAGGIKTMVTAINYLAEGDYIDLRIFHNFGAARDANGGGDGCRLEVHLLSI